MSSQPKGTLIIIGGHEEKGGDGDREILTEVSKHARGRKKNLLLITVATSEPEAMAKQYRATFKDLGVPDLDVLDIRSREDAFQPSAIEKVRQASVVFFTGGDQLRITSQIGDSPVYQCLRDIHADGATIAGTSAGAAAMPETMLISGPGDTSDTISALGMAPGLGLVDGVVIDSHFAERGRFGRLLGAVAQNPRNLGLGIDEDTAIVVHGARDFDVLGTGAVYVVDGSGITYSSLSEIHPEGILSLFDVKIHVLGKGDCFDLRERRPRIPEAPREHAAAG